MALSVDTFFACRRLYPSMLPSVEMYYNDNLELFNSPKAQIVNNSRNNNNNNGPRSIYKHDRQSQQNQNVYRPQSKTVNKPTRGDDDKLHSDIISILNKVSPDNYMALANDIKKISIHSTDQFGKMITIIFNKAVSETQFSNVFAKLSGVLSSYSYTSDDGSIYIYRDIMIQQCQRMFNLCIQDSQADIHDNNHDNIPGHIATGCMIFIGNLYNNAFFGGNIVKNCLMLMIDKITGGQITLIDQFSSLLKTSGKIFSIQCPNELNEVFKNINDIIKSGILNTKEYNKYKFALMDLCDMKKLNKW